MRLAFGEERVPDQPPDACFHGGMLRGPYARFAATALTKSGAAAIMLSPKLSGAPAPNRATRATKAPMSSHLFGGRVARGHGAPSRIPLRGSLRIGPVGQVLDCAVAARGYAARRGSAESAAWSRIMRR